MLNGHDGHVDLTVQNTSMRWNKLIKFSKIAKIFNTKVNQNLCQAAKMELFPQVVTGLRGEIRTLP